LNCCSDWPTRRNRPGEGELARRYACSVFVPEPIFVPSLVSRLKAGKWHVVASDDITYCPLVRGESIPLPDLQVFLEWLEKTENQYLLNAWG
jgi:hypothetical protein